MSHRRGTTATAADRGSFSVHLSADGSAVGFTSSAGDLTAAAADPAGSEDIFVYLPSTAAVEGTSRPTGQPFVACTLLDTRIAGGPLRSNLRRTLTVALASSGAGTLAILPFVQGAGAVHAVVVVTGYSD